MNETSREVCMVEDMDETWKVGGEERSEVEVGKWSRKVIKKIDTGLHLRWF